MFATAVFVITALVGSILGLADFGLNTAALIKTQRLNTLQKYITQIQNQLNDNADLRNKVETAYQNRNNDLIVALGQGGAFSATYQAILKDRHKLRKDYAAEIDKLDQHDKNLKDTRDLLESKNSIDKINSVDLDKVDTLVNGAINNTTSNGSSNSVQDNSTSNGVTSIDSLVQGGIDRKPTYANKNQSSTRR